MSDFTFHEDTSSLHGSAHSTPSPDDMATDASSVTPDKSITSTSGSAGMSTSTQNAINSASRRPPRKSTLTQQQKNQKRQRATQDQLVTLEHEFMKNSTPTAATRERIAAEINMTERSVQIWFQNSRRRAKIKMMAKKGLDIGDELSHLPESMRHMLAMEAAREGKPFPSHLLGGGPGTPYGGGNSIMGADLNGSSKVVIHHFSCRSLSIGSWRRVGQNAMDLVIFYSPDRGCITYYINNDSAGYKIEFPFSFIKNISLDAGDASAGHNGSTPRPGGLVIELTRPPNFFMDSPSSGGFYQCGDFTEDQQASQILVHHLGGQPKLLSQQLQKLVSLEAYQNRHSPFDMSVMPASAPVSPTMGIPRPASQPNVHFARPFPPGQMHVGEPRFHGPHHHLHSGMGMPHGHKRQRSRSVPIAIDFSMLHGPMPTFNIQQPSPQAYNGPHQPFFHPMPHHPGPPLGPNLQIDTSAGYGMDLRSMPMSASATTSSEFASPGFYSHHSHPGPSGPAGDFSTPYSMPFLSPSPMVDPAHMIPPSVSPLSHVSHNEPIIAHDSPPIMGIHRSASADMFAMGSDSQLHDETLMLGDMYAKQNLNMPMPSPGFIDENGLLNVSDLQEFHTPMEHPDMHLNPFGTIDPNSLGV